MATTSRKQLSQHWSQYLLPAQTLTEAQDLARRFQATEGFRAYVLERKLKIIPLGLAILLVSISCAVAPVVFLAEMHPLLALPAILLLPIVLIGSLLVLCLVTFSWLENRALARTLGRRIRPARGSLAEWLTNRTKRDFTTLPRIPLVLSIIFLGVPLAMLWSFAFEAVLALMLFAILAPVVFSQLDR